MAAAAHACGKAEIRHRGPDFASEIKALLPYLDRRSVNSQAMSIAEGNQGEKRQYGLSRPDQLNLWLKGRGGAREMIGDILGSERARARPYLLPGMSVDALLDSQSVYGRNLWALLSLEIWHMQVID